MIWFKVKYKKYQKTIATKRFFWSHIMWMQLVGLWPIKLVKNLYLSWLINAIWYGYWQFSAIHIALTHFYTIVKKIKNGGTLDDISLLLMSTMIYTYTVFITLYFQLRHKKFRHLIEFMVLNMRLRSAYGITYYTIEDCYRKMFLKNTFWLTVCTLGTLHWCITPMLFNHRTFPLGCEYPFDAFVSPYYEILYLLQVMGQIQVGVGFGVSGGLFVSSIILISGQYDMLFCSLKNLRATAMILNGDFVNVKNLQSQHNPEMEEIDQYNQGNEYLEELDEIIKYSYGKTNSDLLVSDDSTDHLPPIKRIYPNPKDRYLMEYCDELHIALVDCIRHHQVILDMIKMLEDIYNPFSLSKLGQSGFLICFLTFIVSRTFQIDQKLVNLLEYLSLTSSELLLFCYFGEMVTRQSIRINSAVMRSDWYLCNGSFRRSLLIMLLCSVKPRVLTGGKFYILNFENFRSVLTASFSYYTLLKNIGTTQVRTL